MSFPKAQHVERFGFVKIHRLFERGRADLRVELRRLEARVPEQAADLIGGARWSSVRMGAMDAVISLSPLTPGPQIAFYSLHGSGLKRLRRLLSLRGRYSKWSPGSGISEGR